MGDKWEFKCQHGENECEGNLIQVGIPCIPPNYFVYSVNIVISIFLVH